jgi:hypothetical protein
LPGEEKKTSEDHHILWMKLKRNVMVFKRAMRAALFLLLAFGTSFAEKENIEGNLDEDESFWNRLLCSKGTSMTRPPSEPPPTSPPTPVLIPKPLSYLLYDQVTNVTDALVGGPSQEYEPEYEKFDCELADDFTVPSDVNWTVTSIEIFGLQKGVNGTAESAPPIPTFNVFIYGDDGGKPNVDGAKYAELP